MKWTDRDELPDSNDITPERGGCVVLWAIGCALVLLPLAAMAVGRLAPQQAVSWAWLLFFVALVVAWTEKERNR